MPAYFDTGVLVKLYCRERDSAKAARIASESQLPLIFSPWQELELSNALRLKLFRKELTAEEAALALRRIDEDMTAGVLAGVSYDVAEVFRVSEEFSSQWTGSIGCRTLDIIHVAAATVSEADRFVTFDRRQATLARKAGLSVVDR